MGYTAGQTLPNGANSNTAIGSESLKAGNNAATDNNTALGYRSLYANTSGRYNVALGSTAMDSNLTGEGTVAIGYDAGGAIEDVDFSVLIGYSAMSDSASHADASGTIAVGFQALKALNTGQRNIAIGYQCADSMTTADDNVMIGYQAMAAVTAAQADKNVMVGNYAGDGIANYTSSQNVGIGYAALGGALDDGADNNTAVGYAALLVQSQGYHNTAVGSTAGEAVTTGRNNTLIGWQAGTSGSNHTVTTDHNRVVIGNDDVTHSYIQADWTIGSDVRDKTDIETLPDDAGLKFVNQIRPVTYKWDKRSSYYPHGHEKYGERDHSKKSAEHQVGFIAQELKEVEKSIGWEEDHIVDTTNKDKYKLMNGQITPILVKAIQQLSAKVDELESKLNN